MLRMRPLNIVKKPILEKQSITLAFMFMVGPEELFGEF